MNVLGILPFARFLLQSCLSEGDIAVDCTVGNGHDTVFLSTLVGQTGEIYGFDIQEAAISQTSNRLNKENIKTPVHLFCQGHQKLKDFIPSSIHGKVKGAIFNLGYLPGGDKTIVTTAATTIQAIQALLDIMAPGGIIVTVIYHGHEQGQEEKNDVVSFVKRLPQEQAHVLQYEFINQKNNPPFIVAIEKRKA